MSPDFHRHGLFHPRRSAVSQLSKAPSVVGRIRKEALQPAHRIRTGRPSALPKPHHCCGRFYYFFAALSASSCRLFFRYPGAGERGRMGQDGDRMGMWHISIPERRTHPLFFRYPLYRNSERNRSIRTAPPATQRSLAIALQQPSTAAPAIAFAPRTPQQSLCKQSCTTIIQRNKNIILCRSRAKNECRTPANAATLQHFRKFSCNLQLCPRPAHIARFNVRARESN